jgi:hypothetical protein
VQPGDARPWLADVSFTAAAQRQERFVDGNHASTQCVGDEEAWSSVGRHSVVVYAGFAFKTPIWTSMPVKS